MGQKIRKKTIQKSNQSKKTVSVVNSVFKIESGGCKITITEYSDKTRKTIVRLPYGLISNHKAVFEDENISIKVSVQENWKAGLNICFTALSSIERNISGAEKRMEYSLEFKKKEYIPEKVPAIINAQTKQAPVTQNLCRHRTNKYYENNYTVSNIKNPFVGGGVNKK